MSGRKAKGGAGELPGLFPEGRDWTALEKVYGKSARTLKRYDHAGRQAGDPCPLEEPVKMPGWWQKHMKQQVPPAILAAAKKFGGKAEPAAVVIPAEPEPPGDEETELPISDDELGLEKTLERLAQMEVKLARKAHEAGKTQAWLNTISRMGTVAEKLRLEHERQRKLIPITEAETMIHEFHAPIERETRQLIRTMCELSGIPCTPHVQDAWNKECDRLFARFQEEVFR